MLWSCFGKNCKFGLANFFNLTILHCPCGPTHFRVITKIFGAWFQKEIVLRFLEFWVSGFWDFCFFLYLVCYISGLWLPFSGRLKPKIPIQNCWKFAEFRQFWWSSENVTTIDVRYQLITESATWSPTTCFKKRFANICISFEPYFLDRAYGSHKIVCIWIEILSLVEKQQSFIRFYMLPNTFWRILDDSKIFHA